MRPDTIRMKSEEQYVGEFHWKPMMKGLQFFAILREAHAPHFTAESLVLGSVHECDCHNQVGQDAVAGLFN